MTKEIKIITKDVIDFNLKKDVSEEDLRPSLVEVVVTVEYNNEECYITFQTQDGNEGGAYNPELCINFISYTLKSAIIDEVKKAAKVQEVWDKYMQDNYDDFDKSCEGFCASDCCNTMKFKY